MSNQSVEITAIYGTEIYALLQGQWNLENQSVVIIMHSYILDSF